MIQKWYDVLDEEGIWRVGECFSQDENQMKVIGLDGFHPNFTSLYCQHSDKILPVRTKTAGLTVPEKKRPLRQAISMQQLQNISGRLNLYLFKPNLLEFDPKLIRSSIRTQFLIIVNKIFSTPYEIISQIKMLSLTINNFFLSLLTFYTRILNSSKALITSQSSESGQQLYKSVYQLTILVAMILGIHPHSSWLYENKLNLNLKPSGYIDYLIKSDGISPLRHFIKQVTACVKQPTIFDMEICLEVINLFLELFEKSKTDLMEGENRTATLMMLDDVINNLKHLADADAEIKQQLAQDLELVSKIEAMHFKLRPNKHCSLRKHLLQREDTEVSKPASNLHEIDKPTVEEASSSKISRLEDRMKKLEELLVQQKGISHSGVSQEQSSTPIDFFSKQCPVENLGEEQFLSSVEFALECGDTTTARKLVRWRKSLLQVGRIVGWKVALAIGCSTFKKGEITAQDIIEANYDMLIQGTKQ